ncbi:MAG: SYNERG-CTERM sorting domain-containing protein, partial [Fretibacterium sp.]|nr:SYNERG-CTERM sorting domain-containing protein [Fretibacterium sp.]
NVPSKPTTYTTTPKIEEKYVSQAPASGWTSFPITGIVDANGTPSPAKTLFYVWLNIISPLSVAANLADDEWGPYLLESEKEGELEFDVSKLKNLDGTPVTDFPGGNCIITYSTTLDGKGGFSGTTEQVKVAKSSSSTSNVTSNKGSGGCDAGFGALALAVLAAGVLLKKHSK